MTIFKELIVCKGYYVFRSIEYDRAKIIKMRLNNYQLNTPVKVV